MNAEEGLIDLDIRRFSKKLFPFLWVHHGVISTVPPPGPMSPVKISDTAERMSEAVLVYSYTLRPVLQYYMEKHSHTMKLSKHSFWTHLAFLCLRIRLVRDNVFDYLLNATAVMAEAALFCSWSHLDDVHGWAAKFFAAFFELEVSGPFHSAGGWTGMMGYIRDGDLPRLFEYVSPYRLDMDSPVDGVPVMITVASEALSAERRERIASARRVERCVQAKLLTARVFNWDFVEKFPANPGFFRRTPNVRRRKPKTPWFVSEDAEPCLLNSAPSLRCMEDKPGFKLKERSLSIEAESVRTLSDVKKESEIFADEKKLGENSLDEHQLLRSVKGRYFQGSCVSASQRVISSWKSKCHEETPSDDLSNEKSPRISPKNACNLNEIFNTSSSSQVDIFISPKNRCVKKESRLSCSSPELNPKSLFTMLHPVSKIINRKNDNPDISDTNNIKSSEILRSSENRKLQRLSLPNMNCVGLMDEDMTNSLYAFKNSIWKDDFTLKKSRQTQDRRSTHKKPLIQKMNAIPDSKESFTFDKTENMCVEKITVERKDILILNSRNLQSSKYSIFEENEALPENVYESQNGFANLETFIISESKKDKHSQRDELDKLTVALLLTEVNDTFTKTDARNGERIRTDSSSKSEKEANPLQGDISSNKSSPCTFQCDDDHSESSSSSTSSGICNDLQDSRTRLTNLGNACHLHDALKLPGVDVPDEPCRKPSPEIRKLQLCNDPTNVSPCSSTDKSDSEDGVVIKTAAQAVLFKRGLLGSLAKRVRRARRSKGSPVQTPEKLKTPPQTNFVSKREKDSKTIGDIIRALENSGIPKPFKI